MFRIICSTFFFAVLLLDIASAQGTKATGGGDFLGRKGANASGSPLRSVRPIIISGNVRTSSGEAPIEPVAIKRVCDLDAYIVGYTNHNGKFSLDVGGNARFAVMDASIGGGALGVPRNNLASFNSMPSQIGLSHCHLIAELSGYRSSQIRLTRRRSLDRPDVGTLILTPLGGSPDVFVSATTLAAPKGAKDAFDKALKELSKGRASKLPRAVALLEKAVSRYPVYAAAWAILGETKQRMGDAAGAAEAYASAVDADPGYLRPYEPLATIRLEQQDWPRAVQLTVKALKLDPSNAVLHWLHAISQFKSGNDEQALTSLERVESDEAGAQHFPQTHHIRGLIFSERGSFAEAAEELRLFLDAAPEAPAAESVRQRLHEWQELGVI